MILGMRETEALSRPLGSGRRRREDSSRRRGDGLDWIGVSGGSLGRESRFSSRLGVWESALSSLSGVRGKAPAANDFGTF